MVFIIAFHGKPAVGKSTACQHLLNCYGKDDVEIWDSIPDLNSAVEFDPERGLHYASNFRLNVHRVGIEINKITKPILLISSINNQEESDFVHGLGGIIVHLFRPEQINAKPLRKYEAIGDKIDVFIKNDTDLSSFLDRVKSNLSTIVDRQLELY